MALGSWQSTASGLRFREETVGEGELPVADLRVAVQYTAKIASGELQGEVYDTTRGSGEPYVFKLGAGGVVAGWEEGLSSMRVGGRRTLSIPNSLAYGGQSYIGNKQRVPPGSDLEIEVELVGLYGSVDYSWIKNVFTLQNAGPFAILIVIGVFQGLAAMPRDDLPPWVAELIPKVLGSQYRKL